MDLPDIGVLVRAADKALHPMVRRWVATQDREAALREELRWWVEVAARDLDYARGYRAAQPHSGAPAEEFLDRWAAVTRGLSVLAGPRYRDRDPDTPFVGVVGSNRPVTEQDLGPLRDFAREHFAIFRPRYVSVWTAGPASAWGKTAGDSRLLAAPLASLRARRVPDDLSLCRIEDLSSYDRYLRLYDRHRDLDPAHRLQARPESSESFSALVEERTAWSVQVAGRWAGVVAARPDVASGLRGACIVELVLDPAFCGQGYGKALSLLLAQSLPQPDHQFLFGTIHVDNRAAYRSALGAGRVDVGGEVIITL